MVTSSVLNKLRNGLPYSRFRLCSPHRPIPNHLSAFAVDVVVLLKLDLHLLTSRGAQAMIHPLLPGRASPRTPGNLHRGMGGGSTIGSEFLPSCRCSLSYPPFRWSTFFVLCRFMLSVAAARLNALPVLALQRCGAATDVDGRAATASRLRARVMDNKTKDVLPADRAGFLFPASFRGPRPPPLSCPSLNRSRFHAGGNQPLC